MGYLILKPAAIPASKSLGVNSVSIQNGAGPHASLGEPAGGRSVATGNLHSDRSNSIKDLRTRPADGRIERTESASLKSDSGSARVKSSSFVNGSELHSSVPSVTVQSGTSRSTENLKQLDESNNRSSDDSTKIAVKMSTEPEGRATVKRSANAGSLSKQLKQDPVKDDTKSVKPVGRTSNISVDRDPFSHLSEGRESGTAGVSSTIVGNNNTVSASNKGIPSTKSAEHATESKMEIANVRSADLKVSAVRDDAEASNIVQSSRSSVHSPRRDGAVPASKSSDQPQKRGSPAEEVDRLNKRTKGETEFRVLDGGEVRVSERERPIDIRATDRLHLADVDKPGTDKQMANRSIDKSIDGSKDKSSERHDRDNGVRLECLDKPHGDDNVSEKRDRSTERYGRECSVERAQERGAADRNSEGLAKDERNKDDRSKLRNTETSANKSYVEDRFHGQDLRPPPPPPLPPNVVPKSVNANRRDEDADRQFGTARHAQRLSPRHEEKERRRSEENILPHFVAGGGKGSRKRKGESEPSEGGYRFKCWI